MKYIISKIDNSYPERITRKEKNNYYNFIFPRQIVKLNG